MFTVQIYEEVAAEEKTRVYQQVADTGGEDGGAKYAYVSDVKNIQKDELIYKQKLESIDLKKIIEAINETKQTSS